MLWENQIVSKIFVFLASFHFQFSASTKTKGKTKMEPSGYQNIVFTAIAFDRDSLLDDDTSTITQGLLCAIDEQSIEDNEESLKTKNIKSQNDPIVAKSLFAGFLTGFFVHAIAIASYAALVIYFGYEKPTSRFELSGNWFLYSILSVLTQLDILVYILIWVAFTCTLSRSGLKMIQEQLNENVKRRYIFLIGVKFLVGIVLGAFLAWTLIDYILGFQVPLLPIIGTVAIDLVLCYAMIWCFDEGTKLGENDEEGDDEDDEDDEETGALFF